MAGDVPRCGRLGVVVVQLEARIIAQSRTQRQSAVNPPPAVCALVRIRYEARVVAACQNKEVPQNSQWSADHQLYTNTVLQKRNLVQSPLASAPTQTYLLSRWACPDVRWLSGS